MKLDINHFKWTREPQSYLITENTIEVVTWPKIFT